MTQIELCNKLKTVGFPVAYHHFTTSPEPPYIVYIRTNDDNISSDYKVHGKFKNYQVELYTVKKDLEAEQKIEEILNTIDPEYKTFEEYIQSEQMYQVVYQIKVIERR